MAQDLLEKGLRNASELIVGGCSAGGLATYLHADQWCNLLLVQQCQENIRESSKDSRDCVWKVRQSATSAWKSRFKAEQPSGRCVAMPDSGFFIDYQVGLKGVWGWEHLPRGSQDPMPAGEQLAARHHQWQLSLASNGPF